MDPFSPGVVSGLALEAGKRLIRDREDVRKLLAEAGLDKYPKSTRKVLETWITEERVQRLLTGDEPHQAVEGLQILLEERGLELGSNDLREVIDRASTALLDRRLAGRAVREEHDKTRRLIQRYASPVLPQSRPLPYVVEVELELLDSDDAGRLREWLTHEPPPTAAGFAKLAAPGGMLSTMSLPAWRAAAEMSASHGFEAAAVALWRGAVERSPRPEDVQPRLALALSAAGQAQEAFTLAEEAVNVPARSKLAEITAAALKEDWGAALKVDGLDLDDPDDWLAGLLQVQALEQSQRFDHAVALAEKLAASRESAGAWQAVGGLRLQRVIENRTTDRTGDLNAASAAAREALELRLRWGVPLGPAFDIAVKAAFLGDDLETVRSVVHAVVENGWTLDLADPDTARFVAVSHIAAGDDLTALPGLSEEARRWTELIAAPDREQDEDTGGRRFEVLRELLDTAEDTNERMRVLIQLAHMDAVEDAELASLQEESEAAAAAVRGARHVARGEARAAVQAAREAAAAPGMASDMIAMVHLRFDQYDELVELVSDNWTRLQDVGLVTLSLEAMAPLAGDSAHSENLRVLRDLASTALRREDLTTAQRKRLSRALLESSVTSGAWDAAEGDARALLKCELSSDEQQRTWWVLVQVLLNSGYPRRAWDAVQLAGGGLLTPTNAAQSALGASLTHAYSQDPAHVHSLLSHVKLEDEDAAAHVLLPAWMLALRLDDRLAVEAVHAVLADFVVRYPNSRHVRSVPAEEMLTEERLRREIPPLPPELHLLIRRVWAGQVSPIVLCVTTSKAYSTILLEGVGPYVFAGSSSLITRQIDRLSAPRALVERCLVDLTALLVLARMDQQLEKSGHPRVATKVLRGIRGGFLTPEAALDLTEAAALQPPGVERLFISPGTEGHPLPTVNEVSHAEVADRQRLFELMEELADQLGRSSFVEEASMLGDDILEGHPNLVAATSALEIGRASGWTVWMDDGQLRGQLRSGGTPGFDTFALLDALAEARLLTADERSECFDALLRAGVVPLPYSADDLVVRVSDIGADLADATAGAVLLPGWWRAENTVARSRVDRLLAVLAAKTGESFPTWLYRLLIGAASGRDPAVATQMLLAVASRYPELRDSTEHLVWAWAEALEVVTGVRPERTRIGDHARAVENRWMGDEFISEFSPGLREIIEELAGVPVWTSNK